MWLVCIDLSLWSFPWDFLAYMHAATCSYTEILVGDLAPSMYVLRAVTSSKVPYPPSVSASCTLGTI